MKLLQFGFDRRDGGGRVYQPHNYPRNCAAYVGTHDNDTALGWLETADPEDVALAREYLRLEKGKEENWGMMAALWGSPADWVIVQMQDVLGLGTEARMNTPSTLGGNWQWRALPGSWDDGWRPGCAGRWRCMSGCSNGKGMLQKDFIASGTSGVHLVLSTSARSKRNNPPAAEHLSRTCVHLDVPEAYVLFFVTSPHIYSRTRVLLHHEFHDLQHPLCFIDHSKTDCNSPFLFLFHNVPHNFYAFCSQILFVCSFCL